MRTIADGRQTCSGWQPGRSPVVDWHSPASHSRPVYRDGRTHSPASGSPRDGKAERAGVRGPWSGHEVVGDVVSFAHTRIRRRPGGLRRGGRATGAYRWLRVAIVPILALTRIANRHFSVGRFVNILEELRLAADGESVTGGLSTTGYDTSGNILFRASGTLSASRIRVNTPAP